MDECSGLFGSVWIDRCGVAETGVVMGGKRLQIKMTNPKRSRRPSRPFSVNGNSPGSSRGSMMDRSNVFLLVFYPSSVASLP